MTNILKRLIRPIAPSIQFMGYSIGLMKLGACLRHVNGAIIIMYHSVADQPEALWIDPSNHVAPNVFAKQIEFLIRRKRVIALSELVSMIQLGKRCSKESIVITFDDGYIDNLRIAAPILDHYGLSATLFLPTGYIDRRESQWVDQAYTTFNFRQNNRFTWGERPETIFNLNEPKQYAACYQAVCDSLLIASPSKRRMLLNELHRQLNPCACPPSLTMSWDDARALVKRHKCFEIGAHSIEHTSMNTLIDCEARWELQGCYNRIKEEMGNPPRYFSFPYGRTSARLRRLVAETGYEAAFGSAGAGPLVNEEIDLFALPRVEAPASLRRFGMAISAGNTGIWRRMGR
jgi:peptidoglycan/xylan/chitin deacetylase (PgdA/CDA1 family)